ncbi:MAG: DUF1963 domain-containing protein [Myxococcales bacterium]|nr:DUF1963 domain-containing protein [Myxococcales bacterium]
MAPRRSNKSPWPPGGPGGPPTPTRPATRDWPDPLRFVPTASMAAVAPAGMVAFTLDDARPRGTVVIWETFFAGFDAPEVVTSLDDVERWSPGAANGPFVICPDAVVLTVEGDAGIDALAARFADDYGMVRRLPVEGLPRYEVVLPLATGVQFDELRTASEAAAAKLDDAWTLVTLGCAPEAAEQQHLGAVCVAHVPHEVRHLHGRFQPTAYRPRFKSPLDLPPDDGKPLGLPAPLEPLVRELGMTSDAKKLAASLRDGVLLVLDGASAPAPEVGANRLGGPADLPAGHAWPVYDGVPMRLLLQLRLADVAPHDVAGRLPHDGHLWVFVNEGLVPSSAVSARQRHQVVSVVYAPDGAALVRQSRPGGGDLPAHPFTLRHVPTLPSPRSPHLNVDRLSGDYATLHARFEEAVYGEPAPSYLLGHVGRGDWMGAIKKRDVQLVQVRGSYADMDELDLLHVVVPEEDLAARVFTAARLETEMG